MVISEFENESPKPEDKEIVMKEREEISIEEIMINEQLTASQINAMTQAIIEGVPEDIIKNMVIKHASADRISLIIQLYKNRRDDIVNE